jgi:hypothetical protein
MSTSTPKGKNERTINIYIYIYIKKPSAQFFMQVNSSIRELDNI